MIKYIKASPDASGFYTDEELDAFVKEQREKRETYYKEKAKADAKEKARIDELQRKALRDEQRKLYNYLSKHFDNVELTADCIQ